jgi:lysozyme
MSFKGEVLMGVMKVGVDAVSIIKEYEGLRLTAYQCPAGIWTIGWGHTKGVKEGQRISIDQARAFLQADVAEVAAGVNSLLKVGVTQYQFDALVSLAFNVGLDIDVDTKAEGLGDSRLLELVNAGEFTFASLEFGKWVYARHKRRPGLVARRRQESELFQGKLIK